jgi:hypothetical protein
MTILGQHTVAETRDLIRAIEFRVNKDVQQFGRIQAQRLNPPTAAQTKLDSDMTAFIREWTDTRDKQTVLMTASVLANPSVAPFILPAEKQFVAINDVVSVRIPHLMDIEQRIDTEAANIGLAPTDRSGAPPQNSPDADFVALKKLDSAIKDGETAAKGAAKSNTGLIIGAAVLGVIGVVVVTKVYL